MRFVIGKHHNINVIGSMMMKLMGDVVCMSAVSNE